MTTDVIRRRRLLAGGLAAAVLVAAVVVVVFVVRSRHGEPPARHLTGYWQNYSSSRSANLRLSGVPTEYDVIAVAFAVPDRSHAGGIDFSVDSGLSSALGGYSDDDLTADIDTVQRDGRQVLLSVGGESDDVKISDATRAATFARSAAALLDKFGFDGIDIDLEHGISPGPLASALHQLVTARPGTLVTLAPQTLDVQPGGDYLALIDRIKDILTSVHTQFYNSGSMTGCDGETYVEGGPDFVTAQVCTLLKHVRADQIALGFPASKSSASNGYVPPSVVTAAVNCLVLLRSCGRYRPTKAAPGLYGVMTWSVNNDAASHYAFAKPIRHTLTTLPPP
ncbi:MAG: chitinase [Cryptosporangiaceae bacterium]|nr:chitinase [Cryptosporangiaceae bacterium]